MNNNTFVGRSLIIATVASGAVLLTWAWQSVHATFQKGIADGESIRVSMKVSCAVSEGAASTPGFSGCNSIL